MAEVLADEESDSDDLIHAFGDVEELRHEIADVLLELIEAQQKEKS